MPPATPPITEAAHAGSRRAGTAARVFAYALAASVLLIAAALLVWMQMFRGVYEAGIGEQRVIALEDGSQVDLNARSRLRVRFTDGVRSVDLLSGQALFRVAKDKARPFVVRSGNASVRAVGTQFDVYRKSAGTIVTVVEGSVAVAPTKAPAVASNVAVLTAGQQIVVTSSTLPEPRLADVAIATAWTQQRLAFSRARLAEVVEEFNRYNKRQLFIKDKALADFRISGNFPSADPAPLLGFLRVQPGIRVHESGDGIEIALESQATAR
jgi:transmembrane sensor